METKWQLLLYTGKIFGTKLLMAYFLQNSQG